VLRALNENNGSTVLQLNRVTGIPRAAIYRVLETLMDDGYVTRSGPRDAFWLSVDVRTLAYGYTSRDWIAEIAAPILAEFGREVVWPVDIATFDGDAMLIRQTTYQTSPLAIDRDHGPRRGYSGYRVPLIETALGLAYLAFCPSTERNTILESIMKTGAPPEGGSYDRLKLERLISRVRRQGYGMREGGFVPSTGSIALPVMHGEQVFACINLHYMLSVMTLPQAVERYFDTMKRVAQDLSREFAEKVDEAHTNS